MKTYTICRSQRNKVSKGSRWLQKKKEPVKEDITLSKQHVLVMPNERDSPLSATRDEELRLPGNDASQSNNESDYNTRYENGQLGEMFRA